MMHGRRNAAHRHKRKKKVVTEWASMAAAQPNYVAKKVRILHIAFYTWASDGPSKLREKFKLLPRLN
jgi:hypothetical protein